MTPSRFICGALLCAIACTTQAQTAAPAAPNGAIAPPSAFTWGADLRARNEYYDSSVTLNDSAANSEQDYFRTRARLWASYAPVADLLFSARIAAEPRHWVRPTTAKQHNGRGPEWRYAIVDNLNVKWTTAIANSPVTVTVGRQEFQFGEAGNAWLVADGTPAEGSWTAFFDAARATVDLKSFNTRIDVIALDQQARPADNLPILGGRSTYSLAEQDEKAVILYASNKAVNNTQIDGYLIYKNDTPVLATGDDGEIYTLGAKLSGTPATHWAYSVEGAYQWGKKLDRGVKNPLAVTVARDIAVYGANAKLTYLFNDGLKNTVSLVGEYLSADKPGTTDKDEMFDILWGRCPHWSEIGANTFANETGGRNAQFNNLARVGAKWTFAPMKGMTASATYNALYALEELPTRATNLALFSQNGKFRGNYFQAFVRQTFNKHLSALLFGEVYFQGNYYVHRDTMSFVRTEIMLSF